MDIRTRRDTLTGLLCNQDFHDRCRHLLESHPRTSFVLGVTNIDEFRAINDLHGWEAGDTLLSTLASRLICLVGDEGVCARIYADRFGFCLPCRSFLPDAFHAGLEDAIFWNEPDRVHIGLYEVLERDVPVGLMVEYALLALESLERHRAPAWSWYEEGMLEGARFRQQVIEGVTTGLSDGQFSLCFQPIFHCGTRKVAAAEALIRWHHPDLGEVCPDVFLPILERTSLVGRVDLFVLGEVCRLQARRVAAGDLVVPISVNLSRNDMSDPSFIPKAIALVDSFSLDHALVDFEITESAYTDYALLAADSLSVAGSGVGTLRRFGFKVLIDDYGTGYCNLDLLRRVPFDIMKIDQALISDLSDPFSANIVRHLIGAAADNGRLTVAEGVETIEQLEVLEGMGCSFLQGYYLSKPLAPGAFSAVLNRAGLADRSCEMM